MNPWDQPALDGLTALWKARLLSRMFRIMAGTYVRLGCNCWCEPCGKIHSLAYHQEHCPT